MRLFPRIGHLPGSRAAADDRHADPALAVRCTTRGHVGDRVIVSEKLDGTCVTIGREGGAVVARGREGGRCDASPNVGRRAFAAWVASQPARWAALVEGERLVLEWLVLAHAVRYALPHEPAVLLDLHRGGWRPWDEVAARARALALPGAAVVHDGGPCPLDEARERLGRHGQHGARDPAEGLVYRIEGGDGRLRARAKWVRPGLVPGQWLADHGSGVHVWNAWTGGWSVPVEVRADGAPG